MIEKSLPSDQDLIGCLATAYGIKVKTFTFLPLGADTNAAVYKAQTENDAAYFVKIKEGHHHDPGVIIQQLLHDAGIQEVIPLVQTNKNQRVHYIGDFSLMVYPFIEGRDGFSQNLTNEQWISLGKALRQVHEFQLPSSIKDRVNREVYCRKWRKDLRSILTHIDTGIEATDTISSNLLAFMKEQRATLQRLVDRAEQLADEIQRQSPENVLSHSDIHGGNVFIASDDTLYIVDWDQPIMAPKERDLMFIGGGVANVWNDPRQVEFFYKGYGATEVNREILAYYRYERIVQDIAFYSLQLLLTADGGKGREVMYKHFMDMFQPNGVIDIALGTEK